MIQRIQQRVVRLGLLSAMLLPIGQVSAETNDPNIRVLGISQHTKIPNFIQFNSGHELLESQLEPWIRSEYNLPENVSLKAYSTENDQLGYQVTRYKEYVNNVPVENSMIITHSNAGRIFSLNGDIFNAIPSAGTPTLAENAALTKALSIIGASKYKWENAAETAAMKEAFHQPDFSYYPKGELVLVHENGTDYSAANFHLAWKFNIYAEKPLSRAYYYIDAGNGKLLNKQDIIHTLDVVGTANTKFSGTQTMTSDNYGTATQYRLRETGRGNGISTFNLNNNTTYSNTDFTNTSSTWNITGTNQAATDAHWGAEKTYDYYQSVHSRNSIDGAGYNLLSYVHYDVNYVNAFWDGSRMTYGDGQISQGFFIMTALDVCGHEITHGLTSYTANLSGGEADALNEGYSDIFGTTIEAYARPTQHDWLMGADITCTTAGVADHVGIRDMSNPNALGQPDTYHGTYWDAAMEPHTNAGPLTYWYYLLCQGGSGTNDNGNAFTVSGITMAKARQIAFRALTVYETSGTTYADARTYSIQAATDLYGGCSPEVIATTNAWYAVGVGAAYVATPVAASFTANSTSSCTLPFTVTFNNTSVNGSTASWHFGDGGSSTTYSPSYTYNAAGTYTVTMSVASACGTDSTFHTSYIVINPPAAPTASSVSSCTSPASFTLNATGGGTINWYANASGGTSLHTGASYTTPSLSTTTTYYVESQTPGTTGNVGPTTTSFGTGAYHNNTSTQYLIFDVLQPCTIQTVLVNSGASGTRNVLLWDNTGTLLQTIPVAFPSGTGTVTLNVHLTPGTGYRLGGISMNLYRNNSGASYPYTLGGVINITGSSAGSAYYYYYYNWQVVTDPCISARTAVVASIGAPIVAYSAAAYDTVCVSAADFSLTGGSPAGGTYSGPGVTAGTFSPAAAGAGVQTITYSYTDPGGCSASANSNIYVDPCISTSINSNGQVQDIQIFPNPANEQLQIEITERTNEELQLSVVDALGRLLINKQISVTNGKSSQQIDVSNLAPGVYFIQLRDSKGTNTKRFAKN